MSITKKNILINKKVTKIQVIFDGQNIFKNFLLIHVKVNDDSCCKSNVLEIVWLFI